MKRKKSIYMSLTSSPNSNSREFFYTNKISIANIIKSPVNVIMNNYVPRNLIAKFLTFPIQYIQVKIRKYALKLIACDYKLTTIQLQIQMIFLLQTNSF